MTNNMTLIDEPPKWDYYHSVFFVITVVSTIGKKLRIVLKFSKIVLIWIGYGNLSPTTMLSRIFLIFYAFIGIPINGIVMVAMGGYFGHTVSETRKSFTSNRLSQDNFFEQLSNYRIIYFNFFSMFFSSSRASITDGRNLVGSTISLDSV